MEYSITPSRHIGRLDYRLDAEHLRMRRDKTGAEVAIPYAAIHTIEVRRPMPRLMTTRVRSDIGEIVIESQEHRDFGRAFIPEYSAFVRSLFEALEKRGVNVTIVVGSSTVWWIGLAVGAFTTLLAVLTLGSLAFGGLVLSPAFLGYAVMYFGVWVAMRSGRTRTVAYADIPQYCLPPRVAGAAR